MPDRARGRILCAAFVLLCSLGAIGAALQAMQAGDALSRVDAYSEANAIREVRNFRDHGLLADDGLGNVIYPGLYPDQGFMAYPEHLARSVTPSGVYTHYPPGPEYLLFMAMKVLGPEPIGPLRLLPILVCWGAAVFFGLSVRRRFGTLVGWLVMSACALLPVFSDADGYLHAQGYSLALLLVEIGFALRTRPRIAPFLLLGFLQGWMSFDYFFLVVTVPAALALAMPRIVRGAEFNRGLTIRRCGAAAAGFMLAHLLHFAEVCAFFGSVQAALHDIGEAAAYRSGGETSPDPLIRLLLTAAILWHYFVGQAPVSLFFWHPDAATPNNWQMFRFLGLTPGPWWALVTAFCLWHARRRGAATADTLLRRWLVVSLCGFVPSALWYIVMVNHAMVHVHYLYRHLFFCFFLGLLFTTVAIRDWLGAADRTRLTTAAYRAPAAGLIRSSAAKSV